MSFGKYNNYNYNYISYAYIELILLLNIYIQFVLYGKTDQEKT